VGRRTVAEEIRRVVARLGGTPATREVPPPEAEIHAPPLCVAEAAALALEIGVGTGTVAGPTADPRRFAPAITAVEASGPSTLLRARVSEERPAIAAPAVRGRAPGIVARAREGALGGLRARPSAVALCDARPRPGPAGLGERVRVGAVPSLPPLVALGGPPRPDGPLYLSYRARVDWGLIGRERLARGWARMLGDHARPPEDLRLVGVFGPLPLAAVAAVSLAADGRLAIRLRRPQLPGRAGDVVLALHEPSGTLLRSDVV